MTERNGLFLVWITWREYISVSMASFVYSNYEHIMVPITLTAIMFDNKIKVHVASETLIVKHSLHWESVCP